MPLIVKQKRFCEEYLVDFNAAQASIRAGYSKNTAKEIGYENLNKTEIQQNIQAQLKVLQERTGITQERVLNELAKVAFFDVRNIYKRGNLLKEISELDENSSGAIAGIEVSEMYKGDKKLSSQTKNGKEMLLQKRRLSAKLLRLKTSINGTDKAELIAGYYYKFYKAVML
jgi:phage terminase small subunit